MKNRFLFIISAVILLSSCHRHDTVESNADQSFCISDSLMRNVTLDTLKEEMAMSDLKLSGKITFNEDNVVNVFPVVSGHVVDVKVSLGDYVQKGQVLATVRSSDMANYYNDYKTAQYALTIAKKNMDVTAEMKSSGVSSEKDYITAQSEYQKALAQYNKVNEVMKIYGGGGSDTVSGSSYAIKAPISGFIVDKKVNAGMELRPDAGNNLFTISDLKEVWATANVYETDIAKIKIGDAVDVTALSYPDKKIDGKVERISNILNPESNVMAVKIRLLNPDYTLKPGMFANISVLFPDNKKMLAVPSSAVLYEDGKAFMVRYRSKCDVDIEPMTPYKSYSNKTYFDSDSLRAGDLVVDKSGLFIFTALKKL